MGIIGALLCYALGAYYIVLLAYVVFAWVPRPPEPLLPLVDGTRRLVDPVLQPIRRRMPGVPIGGVRLDLSIIIVFLGLSILRSVVC
jgi:YggT family protein